MSKEINNCILLFVKYPEPGKVKTRLAETVGIDAAAKLYRFFVKDILITLRNAKQKAIVCYDKRWPKERYIQWLGEDMLFVAQQGDGLGQKMKNAFINTFGTGMDNAIIIGSDIPDIPAEIFSRSFAALGKHPAVIAPTADGGYCLIGFTAKSFLPEIFDNIDWSTEKVFNQTMQIFQHHKTNYYGLDRWFDIDTIGDLKEMLARNVTTDFRNTASFKLATQILGKVTNV